MRLEIAMSSMKLFPCKKASAAHASALSETEIRAMEVKLDDPEYINGAIYRLATIITDRILNGGWDYEQNEK